MRDVEPQRGEHAVAFVYPSVYEGFGLPVIEAWQDQLPPAFSAHFPSGVLAQYQLPSEPSLQL